MAGERYEPTPVQIAEALHESAGAWRRAFAPFDISPIEEMENGSACFTVWIGTARYWIEVEEA